MDFQKKRTFGEYYQIALNFNYYFMEGVVKFFNEAKGFGFIKDSNGEDIFVHVSGLIDQVKEGDSVTFDVVDGRKGRNAENVRKITS